jgi:hypothetical protein
VTTHIRKNQSINKLQTTFCRKSGSIVFSWSIGKKSADNTQPRKIASKVTCMFGSHFKSKHAVLASLKIHFPITCKEILEHVWISFQAYFKNKHDVSLSLKIHFPITCKAILEHVWITFQAYFKNEHAVSPSLKIHVKQFWSSLDHISQCLRNAPKYFCLTC